MCMVNGSMDSVMKVLHKSCSSWLAPSAQVKRNRGGAAHSCGLRAAKSDATWITIMQGMVHRKRNMTEITLEVRMN